MNQQKFCDLLRKAVKDEENAEKEYGELAKVAEEAGLEEKVKEGIKEIGLEERFHGDWLSLVHTYECGSPGIVVDADVAARTGCRCYVADETEMCFSKGIMGTLSKAQREAYCPSKEILTSGKLVERIRRFKELAKE